MSLVPVKTYKVGQRGERGCVVTLPKVWLEDLQINTGDKLYFYREPNNPTLIISPRRLHDPCCSENSIHEVREVSTSSNTLSEKSQEENEKGEADGSNNSI